MAEVSERKGMLCLEKEKPDEKNIYIIDLKQAVLLMSVMKH